MMLVFGGLVRGGCGLGAAGRAGGLFDRLFDSFAGFTRAFLNATEQFVLLAFDVLEIVVGERGPFLLQLAFGDVPVAFDFDCGHKRLVGSELIFAGRRSDGEAALAASGCSEGGALAKICLWGVLLPTRAYSRPAFISVRANQDGGLFLARFLLTHP